MRLLDDRHRFRCPACGNLTRFDVVERRRVRRYYHFTLAGEPTVEDEEILEGDVERISCRWCGSTSVEVVPRAGEEAAG